MHLFHCPELLGVSVELPEEEAHHATSVLRLAVGARVGLLDGAGTRAEGRSRSRARRDVRYASLNAPPFHQNARRGLLGRGAYQADGPLRMVRGESRGDGTVDHITPLIADRTERGKLRIDRLQRVAISAMKQSQRAWLPMIDDLTTLKQLLAMALPQQRSFGWCEGDHTSLMERYDNKNDVVVLIGPEGDFTGEEAETLRQAGLPSASGPPACARKLPPSPPAPG